MVVVAPEAQLPAYSNQQSIGSSPGEVHLQFAHLVPAMNAGEQNVWLVRARVLMAPAAFKEFVKVCTEHLAKFETDHGPISMGPVQVLFDAGKSS